MNELPELMKPIQLIIQKADCSLNASQRNLKEGDYDFASSRAYYVAFYAMEAALLTKKIYISPDRVRFLPLFSAHTIF